MGWLQLVGSFKSQVSFAEYCLFYRALLQQRPKILRSLLIIATPQYQTDHAAANGGGVQIKRHTHPTRTFHTYVSHTHNLPTYQKVPKSDASECFSFLSHSPPPRLRYTVRDTSIMKHNVMTRVCVDSLNFQQALLPVSRTVKCTTFQRLVLFFCWLFLPYVYVCIYVYIYQAPLSRTGKCTTFVPKGENQLSPTAKMRVHVGVRLCVCVVVCA